MAVLSTKGQIVIPEKLRRKMGLKPGADIAVERVDDTLLLIPAPEDPVKALCGMTKGWFKEDAATMIRRMRDEDNEKDNKDHPWPG